MSARVQGAGGGGSKKQRAPIEAPDSLQSIARARILDLIGEGEIEGFASDVPGVVADNALTAVFLDETPIANADGSLNFKDVQVDTRLGTQHQDHIPGFPSVENETGVGQELTPETPYVRSVSNLDLSAVRVRISTPAMSSADSETGDINGISVRYAIDLAVDGGPYAPVLESAITGKTTSGYERSHRVDLPEATTGWIIRVRRITPMANSATVADSTYVESFTEIVDGKFRYPNSALAGITVDAAQFGNIPTRAYRVLGRRMAVPSNYDPVARTYAGSWDGTFKTAWTNNPAWIWYDLVINDRFGLGDRVNAGQIDKWGLYRIAQYCDQLVPDGRGGMEPRFTCHLYLQTRADALRVLQDLASVFRTMAYWSGGEVVAVADMPADPVYTYTNANVIDGRFSYSGSPGATRYTVALVSWSDPDDFGRQKIEPVTDDEGLARYGIRQTEVIAIGCQSRSQAQRLGKWILLTSRLETDTVEFRVGLDGTIAMPGQIVEIADSLRAGSRIGGRVRAATASAVTLDDAGSIAPGDALICVMPDAVSQSRTVAAVDGDEVTVASPFDAAPLPDSVWAVTTEELATQRVRVLSVARGEGLEVRITAVRHVADKFAAVDSGAAVELPPIVPALPAKVQPPPTGLAVTHREVATDNAAYLVVALEWDAAPGAVAYDVEWRQGHGSWTTAGRVYSTSMEIRNVLPGPFEFRVVAVNAAGLQSVPAYGVYYDVPPNSLQPGYVEDLESDLSQARDEFLAEVVRVEGIVDAVATQAAADAAALNVRADDLRDDLDETIADVSTLSGVTDGLGTEIARVETESIGRDTATVETIDLLGAKNADGTAFILDGDTLRLSPTETLAQWRNSIQGEFASQSSRIDNEAQARQDGDQALATTLATVQATADNAATKAELTSAQNALVAADQALGERIDVTQARFGGEQLLLNGDFEREDGWATTDSSADSGVFSLPDGFSIVAEEPFTGRSRLRVIAGASGRVIFNFVMAPVEQDDVFFVSYVAKISTTGGVPVPAGIAFHIALRFYDEAGGYLENKWAPSIVSTGTTTSYEEFSAELTPPSGAKFMRVIAQQHGGDQTVGQFKIDAIRVERRGPAQRALAAVVDTTRADVSDLDGVVSAHTAQIATHTTQIAGKANSSTVTALSNTVTQQGNTLTAHGTQLSGLTASVGDAEASINELREVSASSLAPSLFNPGFEDGYTGWSTTSPFSDNWNTNLAVIHANTAAAYSGERGLVITGGGAVTLYNRRMNPVRQGHGLRISCRWRTASALGTPTILRVFVRYYDGETYLAHSGIQVTAPANPIGWQFASAMANPPPPEATHYTALIWVPTHPGVGNIVVDDVFIEDVTESEAALLASYVLAMNAGNKMSGVKYLNDGSVSNATFLFDHFDFETADGSFRISDGRTITRSNGYMRVEGKPFGQNNEMVVWYGPEQSNLNNCRRNNAISFETDTGLHYSRGAMFSGTITNGGHSTGVGTTSYTTGPFATNGDPIVVNASFTHSRSQFSGGSGVNMNRFSYGSGSNSATIELWRRIGTGSWQLVASETRAGVLNIETHTEPGVPDHAMWNNTVGINYTDSVGGTGSREYEIRLISNTFQGIVITGGQPQPPAEDSRSIGVVTSE